MDSWVIVGVVVLAGGFLFWMRQADIWRNEAWRLKDERAEAVADAETLRERLEKAEADRRTRCWCDGNDDWRDEGGGG